MSETGQPGAATPGEHDDGTGQHDDPSRSGGGWAPPSGGWSRAAEHADDPEPPARWQPDPAVGWRTSSARHGDLPPPVVGLPDGPEAPARVNGQHTNGVRHAGAETNGVHHPGLDASAARPAPVSAPPGDDRPAPSGDRLVVPAQRPAPPPPAVQVPPVGTAASGFEVPPGFHAPSADRLTADDPSAAPRDWRNPLPAEASADTGRTPERPTDEGADQPRTAEGSRAVDAPRAGESSAIEPDWSGPNWNRPSWGSGWAPPWSRQDDEPAGRQGRDESTPGRVAEPVRAEPPRAYDVDRDGPDTELAPERPSWAGERPAVTPVSAPKERPSWAAPAPSVTPPVDRLPRATDSEPVPTSGPPAPGGSAPPAVERPSWADGATPVSAPPSRPSWAGPAPTSGGPSRPSWAGGVDAAPTSGGPSRPSWAGGADVTPTSGAPSRPSWAGGADVTPTSGAPSRPSWAGGADVTP
ncbi:hypothetical protein ABZS77_09265, partial [Micromonospora sp. NPDC005298]